MDKSCRHPSSSSFSEINSLKFLTLSEGSIPESWFYHSPHFSRYDRRKIFKYFFRKFGLKSLPPIVWASYFSIYLLGNDASLLLGGFTDFKNLNTIQDWIWNSSFIIRRCYPNYLTRIDGHFCEFIDKVTRCIILKKRIECSKRIISSIRSSLIYLINDHDGIGIFSIDNCLEYLPWSSPFPLTARSGEYPSCGEWTHRDKSLSSPEEFRHLTRKMSLPDSRRTEKEHRRYLERITRIMYQSNTSTDMIEYCCEIRKFLIEMLHCWYPRWFHLESLWSFLKHSFVRSPRSFVILIREFMKSPLYIFRFVNSTHTRNRNMSR